MLPTTLGVIVRVWIKVWPVCVIEEGREAISPSKPDFGRKCALVYQLKGSALQVTDLEKKTQDISRQFLHFERRSKHTCIILSFSVFGYRPFWGYRLKNIWADLNREYLEPENGSQRHAVHVSVFWGSEANTAIWDIAFWCLRIEDMCR